MKLYDVMRKEEGKELDRRANEIYSPAPSPVSRKGRRHLRKRIVIFGSIAALLVALYIVGISITRAKIIVTERRIPFSLLGADLQFDKQEKADSGRISFQAMVVSTSITREVYGSGLTNSSAKASGSVVFFNEYSAKSQTVKKGTTLTATNGKKYITLAQVTVTGYTLQNKKKSAGTSPSVQIQAIDAGDSYNSAGTTLTVSGYGNATKTFYARSTAISGGEAGISHTLTDTEKEQALAALTAQLIERLKRETRAQIPPEYITFPELQLPIVDINSFVYKGGAVRFPATMKGTMVSYLIPREELENAIAAKALNSTTYPQVAVPDLGDLVFDLKTAIPTDPSIIPDTITVSVSGSGTIIAKVPVDKVKESVRGIRRRGFEDALSGISEIDTARYTLTPLWSHRFPTKWNRINVETR